MTSPKLIFAFGFRSPYAWIARRLIRGLLPPADAARITPLPCWTPRPETLARLAAGGGAFLYQEMPRTKQIYVMRDINRLCAHLGLTLRWPGDRPDPDWEAPHLLYLRAAAAGCGAAALDLLFDARWRYGLDITDPSLLDAFADELGLPAQAAVQADAVRALHQAFLAGVFGLPYFRVGTDGYWGVDRLPFALERAGLASRAVGEAWLSGCLLDADRATPRLVSDPRLVDAPRLVHAP
jgi:2-hydroxychromene-2-carboxylate isomerase